MSTVEAGNPWRWAAALSAAVGLAGIVFLAVRGEASFFRVYLAAALFLGGGVLFARLSVRPGHWARALSGPEARRFFALTLAVSALLGLAGVVIILGFLSSFRG